MEFQTIDVETSKRGMKLISIDHLISWAYIYWSNLQAVIDIIFKEVQLVSHDITFAVAFIAQSFLPIAQ